ncbi:MAG: TonB family protein [Roseibium sp.]
MNFRRLLLAGFLASILAHGAGSAIFADNSDDVQIAASKGGGVSVIGSIEDLVVGSKVDAVGPDNQLDTIQPEEEPLEPVHDPVTTKPVEPPVRIAVNQPIKTIRQVSPVMPITEKVEAPVVQGLTSDEPVTTKEIAPEKPLESVKPAEPIAPKKLFETIDTKPVKLTKAVLPEVQTAAVPETEVKPVEAEPLKEVVETPIKKPDRQVKKKTKSKKAQTKGAKTNARKGGERVTSRTARSNANGRAEAKTNDNGTKARSNYKGKVVAKLRRAKRYPKKARRGNLSGTARVSFTIAKNGSVSGVRISRSSGHAILDTAALDMVRRASPMPKFPSDMKRSKMILHVPVQFSQ